MVVFEIHVKDIAILPPERDALVAADVHRVRPPAVSLQLVKVLPIMKTKYE